MGGHGIWHSLPSYGTRSTGSNPFFMVPRGSRIGVPMLSPHRYDCDTPQAGVSIRRD